jgi:hypothetical protein
MKTIVVSRAETDVKKAMTEAFGATHFTAETEYKIEVALYETLRDTVNRTLLT